ncbi:MAG TPA: FAD:protein FMN transferase, partial [Isosphaeraceae bacterium]
MKPPRSAVNRRDVLRLRPLKDRPGPEPGARGPGSGTPWGGACDLLKATRPGMGSYFEVRLAAATPGALNLATAALDLIGELESQLTVYRADSEVSRLNATAHLG